MPAGKVHINWWKRFLIVAVVFSLILFVKYWLLGVTVLLGYLLGYVCSPDLDQIGLSSDEGRALRMFGPFGLFWIMIWLPYAYMIPHRHFLSHGWLISTVIRMAYLFSIPVIVIWYRFGYLPDIDAVTGLFLGQLFSDSIHIFLDTFYK